MEPSPPPPPPPPPPPQLSLEKIKSETKRVLNLQPTGRLLGLTYLFLFPFPAATTILYQLLRPYIFLLQSSINQHQSRTIFLAIAYSSVHLLFSSFSAGSITYTAFHTGQPVDLKLAIKSLSASFFPLLATALFLHLTSVLLALLAVFSSEIMAVITFVVLFILTAYFHVNFSMVYPVVVFESKWGFKALKRSRELVKGKREEIAFPMFMSLLFGSSLFLFNEGLNLSFLEASCFDGTWYGWSFSVNLAVQCLLNTAILPLFQVHDMVANTVLYIYCKAESDHCGDDDDIFSCDYVRLDVDGVNVSSNA